MIRLILAAALLLFAVPAAAQEIRGCSSVPGPSVAKTLDTKKLVADIDCFAKVKAQADISTANRQKRLAELKTLADIAEPELGADFTRAPADVPTPPDVIANLVKPFPLAPDNAPDPIGAFRFICQPGPVAYVDPLVWFNQPGKSHLHQFFGNTAVTDRSTYDSLRRTGESTCVNILNRSGYWMPAMLDGKGHVVRPDFVSIYYKQLPHDDPRCGRGPQAMGKACVALPPGLRMIFGHDVMTGKPATGSAFFDCLGTATVQAVSGHFDTITEAAKGCPDGARLGAVISSAQCWDGKRLDSPNHRDHVADISYGSWGYPKCPATHAYVIPAFTMGAWYSVDRERADSWYLSSDEMPGMPRMPAGSTFHADWFGAWDESIMKVWMDNCINRHLNCDSGNLGNGTALRQTGDFSWNANPRLIPIPAREVK